MLNPMTATLTPEEEHHREVVGDAEGDGLGRRSLIRKVSFAALATLGLGSTAILKAKPASAGGSDGCCSLVYSSWSGCYSYCQSINRGYTCWTCNTYCHCCECVVIPYNCWSSPTFYCSYHWGAYCNL